MPNQMIALQARAPQTDILGSSITRSAQMINMMRQQDAAERQALSAAQAAQIAAAQELRAAHQISWVAIIRRSAAAKGYRYLRLPTWNANSVKCACQIFRVHYRTISQHTHKATTTS